MMQTRNHTFRCNLVVCILFMASALPTAGCSLFASDPSLEDAMLVVHLLKDKESGEAKFFAGPYLGGTAVLGRNGEAFWIKSGKVYTVNEEARKLDPGVPPAPSEVRYDEFVRAAVSGDSG